MNIKRIGRISLFTIINLFLILIVALFIYAANYYQADAIANKSLTSENVEIQDSVIVFKPNPKKDMNIGYIFYPGAKVEASSYAPLLSKLADKGISVFLVKMPFNLAIFDINAANTIINNNQSIKKWFIGGHSLGGAMSSSFALKNQDKIAGQILLAAYPLADSKLPTLILYGSNDTVISQDRLAPFTNRIMIKGGNHANFGNYNEQKGDGKADISQEMQQEITIKYIMEFIQKNDR